MTAKRLFLLACLLPLLLSGCALGTQKSAPEKVALQVFAAASLTEAFQALGAQFEASHPGTRVEYSFAGSQQLAQQIDQGAPVDVFASANEQQMQAAVQSGRIAQGDVVVFARNRLVIVVPANNPARLESLEDLSHPGLRLVLAAKEVPVGQYTLDFLEKASQDPSLGPGYKTGLLKNVVSYEENVRAVLNKVVLGEADAGIVYSSDISGENANTVLQIAIPDPFNVEAGYPIAPLKDSSHLVAARSFVEFVTSQEGQKLLARYGFITAQPQH